MNEAVLESLKQYFAEGKLEQAEASIVEYLKSYPQHLVLNKMMSMCLFQRGEFSQAQKCIEIVLSLEPNDAISLNNLGNCYLFQNKHYRAASYFLEALALGDHPEWHRNLGTCYFELGLFNRAAYHYKQAIDGGINNDQMLVRQLDTLKNASRFNDALSISEQISDVAHKYVGRAGIFVALNKPHLVEECLAKISLSTQLHPSVLQGLHDIYRFLGDHKNERKIIDAFAKGSEEEKLLSKVMQESLSKDQLHALEQEPRLSMLSNTTRSTFYFILAGHYKKVDRKRWFSLLTKANRIQSDTERIDTKVEQECFEQIKKKYPSYAELNVHQPSNKAIFIIGMPRSGTTLLETILGNHEKVYAAGESTLVESLLADINPSVPTLMHPHQLKLHYLEATLKSGDLQTFSDNYIKGLEQYSQDSQYIIDKMPHNFMHLGWLAKALPGATFIHCQRDPVATCLSIYEQNLSHFHRYGNDLQSLAEYYKAYQDLMLFWEKAFAHRITTIQYEDLVKQPKKALKPLLSTLGLNWQDNLLDIKSSKRSITTSSLQQVRKDIYQESIHSYQGLESELVTLMSLRNNVLTNTSAIARLKSLFKRMF